MPPSPATRTASPTSSLFETQGARRRQAFDDDRTVLARDVARLADEPAARLASFARVAPGDHGRRLAEVAASAPRGRLAEELVQEVESAVRDGFEGFRRAEADRTEVAWQHLAQQFRARTQERVDRGAQGDRRRRPCRDRARPRRLRVGHGVAGPGGGPGRVVDRPRWQGPGPRQPAVGLGRPRAAGPGLRGRTGHGLARGHRRAAAGGAPDRGRRLPLAVRHQRHPRPARSPGSAGPAAKRPRVVRASAELVVKPMRALATAPGPFRRLLAGIACTGWETSRPPC